MAEIIDKNIGETPLEALERFRAENKIAADVPMTYAGRLDPMAEGKLLILVGDECKQKEKYLGLDKEYEVEIVFGIETDTYDALGLAEIAEVRPLMKSLRGSGGDELDQRWLQRYVGKFNQPYPAYSSKTVNGKQLHELARAGELPAADEMPMKEVEIYSIDLLDSKNIAAHELLKRILSGVALVKGDFRQEQIKSKWQQVLTKISSNIEGAENPEFRSIKIRVKCSSGTYMRSLHIE